MAGPDPKRMYLAINSQNIDSLKKEKPYWSKPFVFLNPTGTGIKYTSLQAAMMLKKMKIVDFLLDQPALDLTVKSTDGKNTVTVAVEAKMGVPTLEKILHKIDLRSLAEVDSSGKGPIDYADPGSDVYEFLHSMGCKTRQEKEVAMAGFFGENVKGTVPGINEHQQRRREANTPRRKSGKRNKSAVTSQSESQDQAKTSRSALSDASNGTVDELDATWRRFDDIDELENALKAYVDEWGDDHEDGDSCVHWLKSIARAKETGKTEKLLAKWNDSIRKLNGDDENEAKEETVEGDRKSVKSRNSRGRSTRRASSTGSVDTEVRQRGRSTGSITVDPEAIKLFFSGKAGDQVKPSRSYQQFFVLAVEFVKVSVRAEVDKARNPLLPQDAEIKCQ
ncbi:hypothetical protein, conserved [Eimeria necatrix]|uniref:Ankyrin repeat-containing protein n=1 Tax=Eimeria necatrix TaxID=51315 RepID=U6MIL8_9EIME|nr:hypothetical protein, conserved [Eimeria necatrix]CDJ63871.1 hypothetical protein, conserved [Eimeria necatrix]